MRLNSNSDSVPIDSSLVRFGSNCCVTLASWLQLFTNADGDVTAFDVSCAYDNPDVAEIVTTRARQF